MSFFLFRPCPPIADATGVSMGMAMAAAVGSRKYFQCHFLQQIDEEETATDEELRERIFQRPLGFALETCIILAGIIQKIFIKK